MNHLVNSTACSNHPIGLTTPLRLLLATTAALWLGNGQAQASEPVTAPPVIQLQFREFFHLPVGPKGLILSETLGKASGKTVQLVGYMVQQENTKPGTFMLTPRPVQMNEHADGDADDLPPATVVVRLDAAQKDWQVPHVRGLIKVSGQLDVGRHEESDGRVSWVRLQLEAGAARTMNAFEMTSYLHHQQHQH
jgi:hypothetical protein